MVSYPWQSQVGKRRCIGEDLGRSLTFLTLAAILKHFTLELEPGFDIWQDPRHGFNLSPPPFKVKFCPRS